ncbi:MAG: endo-1,4-beta-xylanase [Verrucomicrobiia bacterium]|jgi:GH35 family endo-1,4-beta-xylanase
MKNRTKFIIALIPALVFTLLKGAANSPESAEQQFNPILLAQAQNIQAGQIGQKPTRSETIDEKELLAQTESRILKNRTAPLVIEVLDKNGRPANDAKVEVRHLKHLFYFGAGFDRSLLKTNMDEIDIRHRDAFLKLFNYSTVHIYWGFYEPREGFYNTQVVLDSIKWLKEHNLTARAHPIHWNHRASIPRWVIDMKPDSDKFRSLLTERVKQLSSTVLPLVHDADVFNELVNWDRWDNPFTILLRERGKVKTVVECMNEVKQLNPGLRLVVNDYEMSARYYQLLKELIEAGAPIDYIGQQSHMHSGNWQFIQEWEILQRLSQLNKPILFTELSVLSGPRRKIDWSTERPLQEWNSEPEYEKAQADYLEKFYSIAYSHSNCIGIVMWNYSDRRSWLGAPVGVLRKDGSPKPSFNALDNLINTKWRTNGTFPVNKGKVVIPDAYEGEYLIKIGSKEVKTVHSPRSPAIVKIRLD